MTADKFKNCFKGEDGESCAFHNCGPYDDEQCGKLECPHCTIKTEKMHLSNAYLQAKDRGEAE